MEKSIPEIFRRAERAASSGGPRPLLAAFEEAEQQYAGSGWIGLWAVAAGSEAAIGARCLTYQMAKCGVQRPPMRVGCILDSCLLWVLNEWKGDDSSSFVNTLEVLGRIVEARKTVPEHLRSSIWPFLVRSLQSNAMGVRHAALDFLVAANRLRLLDQFLNSAAANRLIELLSESVGNSIEDEEVSEFDLVARALRQPLFEVSMPAYPLHVQRIATDLKIEGESLPNDDGAWTGLSAFMERRTSLEDGAKTAIRVGRMLQTIRTKDGPTTRLVDTIVGFAEWVASIFTRPEFSEEDWMPDFGVLVHAALPASFAVHLEYTNSPPQAVHNQMLELLGAAVQQSQIDGKRFVEVGSSIEPLLAFLGRASEGSTGIDLTLTSPANDQWYQTTHFDLTNLIPSKLEWIRDQSVAANRKRRYIYKDHLPQANTVKLVLRLVDIVLQNGTVTRADIEELNSSRQVAYYRQAARILGLLDRDNIPTFRSRALHGISDSQRLALAAVYFEDSIVGRTWTEWAGMSHLTEVMPESAEAFVKECGIGLSDDTLRRRSSTLVRWHQDLMPFHYRRLKVPMP